MRQDAVRTTARLAAGLAALVTASAVHAQTKIIYVDDDAPAGGDGASWGSAFRELSDALATAQGVWYAVEIHIAQGVYYPDPARIDRLRSFGVHEFSASSAVTLSVPGGISLLGGFRGVGGGVPDERDPSRFVTVLSGDLAGDDGPAFANRADNSRTVLDVRCRDGVLIDGLTIRGGRNEIGRGVVNITPAIPLGNETSRPAVEFSRCTVTDSETSYAGAVFAWGAEIGTIDLHVRRCEFVRNRDNVEGPGGLFIGDGIRARVESCRFIENSAKHVAGAIYVNSGLPAEISDCLFAGNTSGSGWAAALFNGSAPNTISRCTFVGNRSPQHSVIATGFDVFLDCIVRPYPGEPTDRLFDVFTCCHAVGVEHCDIAGGIGAFGGDASVVNWLDGNTDADPQFVDPDGPDNNIDTWDDNDLRLAAGSPCIDAGRPISPRGGELDLAGMPRFFDGDQDGIPGLDMGALEYSIPPCVADIDQSGFVDTEDFDAFIRAFEAGC